MLFVGFEGDKFIFQGLGGIERLCGGSEALGEFGLMAEGLGDPRSNGVTLGREPLNGLGLRGGESSGVGRGGIGRYFGGCELLLECSVGGGELGELRVEGRGFQVGFFGGSLRGI